MISRRLVLALGLALALLGLAGRDEAMAGAAGGSGGSRIKLLDWTAAVPAGWVSQKPASSMRLAQFKVPAAAGSEDGEFIVFFFGEGQGGTVDANIARWQGQFSLPDGKPVTPKIERFKAGSLPVTVAEYTGTYARSVGMGGSEAAKSDQTLLAGIVETAKGNLWVQLHGPRATVSANREAFLGLARGIK